MTLRRIHYSGGDFLTSEDVAHLVLEYAALLGNRGQAATIDVPAAGLVDGATTVALLIGPASQLAAEPADSDDEVPDDRAFLADIRDRISQTETRPWLGDEWNLDI